MNQPPKKAFKIKNDGIKPTQNDFGLKEVTDAQAIKDLEKDYGKPANDEVWYVNPVPCIFVGGRWY